ncbi:MAG: putative RNA uridine N3 methyltransferase [Candidatus Hermodarchaeota archaeon]
MGLEVAIPDTSLVDCSDLRQKTVKVGSLARAMAVFRVDIVTVYETGQVPSSQRKDVALLVRLLEYMDTPQYLRKRVFPISPSLKYAGLLPPLRTSSHPLITSPEDLTEGMHRWGIQVRDGQVDIGIEQLIAHPEPVSERDSTLFRVVGTKPKIRLEVASRDEVEEYWGFKVARIGSLSQKLREASGSTRVVFSRKASSYASLEEEIKSTVANTKSVLAVFGGPRRGVSELFPDEKNEMKKHVDFWVNTIPDQGTETVRLEEAILVSLGLLNKSVGAIVARPGFYN